MRQLTDSDGYVMLVKASEPFGNVLSSTGDAGTNYGFTGEWTDGSGLVHLRARYYAPWQGRFVSRDVWEGDPNMPMSYNAWLYVYANPVKFIDPFGMYICIPTGCCRWMNAALAQLEASSKPFSEIVDDRFDAEDKYFPIFVMFITSDMGFAPLSHVIALPNYYLKSGASPTVSQLGNFAHEITHTSQLFLDRISVWGEAEAYIFEGKVIRELGGTPRNFIDEITSIAYEPGELGFTTRDLNKLCKVRHILVSEFRWYSISPTIWDHLVFPIYYQYCSAP